MTTSLITSDLYLQHQTGPGHPERPQRLESIMRELTQQSLLGRLQRSAPRGCPPETMALAHAESYLQRAEADIAAGLSQLSTGDTTVCSKSWEIAALAAGAGLTAIDALFAGEADNAFCAVRPPGHHATRDTGMGFCVLSNIAIAAKYAQQKYGVGKILIADWDVHHGNGTQDIFYTDDSVLFFSSHQSPWYPGTGAATETGTGPGLGTTVNVPLPAGSGAPEIVGAFEQKLLPVVARFRPELVLVSAGFDSRRGDPLGQFLLDDEDFAQLTKLLRGIADEYAGGKLVSFLEGGYSLDGVAKGVAAHIEALLDA